MLRNPDVMQKCQKEIDGVTGRERMSSMKDKASMPYVVATILEVQRMCSVIPFSVGHSVYELMSRLRCNH